MKIIMKKVIKGKKQPTILPEPGEIEVWKDAVTPEIEGYKYRVSSFGNVERFLNEKWQSQKLSKAGSRQDYLGFWFGPTKQSIKAHRLVCEAFHGPSFSKSHTPDHIDDCGSNNYYKNLKWLTPREQMLKGNVGNSTKSKQIVQFTLTGELVKIHKSTRAAARFMGRNYNGGIYHSCNSESSYLNYHWAYLSVCEIIED